MAVAMDRLKKTDLFYVNPQLDKTTLFDEKRFVENYLAFPKETLDFYGIPYRLNKMVFTFLFKYGYTILGLRNYGRSYNSKEMFLSDWVFNTVKEKALECGLTQDEITATFGTSRIDNTYASYVCYGRQGQYGLFGNIPDKLRNQCLNDYEFERMMKPFEIHTIHIYKEEVDAILEVFGDDYRKVIIALHMIMRAKQFQANLMTKDVVEGKYWWTPCVRDSSQCRRKSWYWNGIEEEPTHKTKRTHSRYFKHELGVEWKVANGTDRKSVITLYNEVYDTLVECGLFIQNDFNGGLKGLNGVARYVGEFKAHKICKARINWSKQKTRAYKPTFLELERDEVPVITITYEDYINGYVLNFIEYLTNSGASCMKPYNKCKVVTCKDCGKRFSVLYDGRSKGKTSSYCVNCGSSKNRTARSRK
jgi:hypothetical protein